MMNKVVGLLGMLLLFFWIGAQAQEKGKMPHKKNRGHQQENILKQLNLSDAQKKELTNVRNDFRQQLAEIRKNESLTVKEYRDQIFDLNKNRRNRISAILTTDQKNKMQEMRKERVARMEKRADKHAEKMKADLGLSDEQVQNLSKMRTENRKQLEQIRENNNLDRTEMKEQLETLHSKQKETLNSILTPEQMQKLEQSRMKQRPGRWGR